MYSTIRYAHINIGSHISVLTKFSCLISSKSSLITPQNTFKIHFEKHPNMLKSVIFVGDIASVLAININNVKKQKRTEDWLKIIPHMGPEKIYSIPDVNWLSENQLYVYM